MDYQKLMRSAVRGLKHIGSFRPAHGCDPHPLDCSLAGRVAQVFLVGSTSAAEICRDAGEDPDYQERHCLSCDARVEQSELNDAGRCGDCAGKRRLR